MQYFRIEFAFKEVSIQVKGEANGVQKNRPEEIGLKPFIIICYN
jgi:hypothetical protein